MGSNDCLRRDKCAMIARYAKSQDAKGLTQVFTTLVPIALLWWGATRLAGASAWLAAIPIPFIILFTVRGFGLMHECGHGSLFRHAWANKGVGFLLGVMSGMPQYVWSQHHNFHHRHNGNWEKYRGPYTTLSVDEYGALTARQQRMYRWKCSLIGAPLAGFVYLIFNPRFTWLMGSAALVGHVVRQKIARPAESLQVHASTFKTRYWSSAREYRHMSWNNLVLLGAWALMCYGLGAAFFFKIYLASLSLAGGAGILLFTVQHNFKHSYASDSGQWDCDTGAISGTSFLILPAWLNWFTASIGYHHIHHLSARIPNYCLFDCHSEYRHLFSDVTRLKLADVPGALKYILWDTRARCLISVAEYRRQMSPAGCVG